MLEEGFISEFYGTVFPQINAPPRMNAPSNKRPLKISDFKINAPPGNAPSQKSEKITVYSSLTQDQILINFYNTGITAYTSRKIKTKLRFFNSSGKSVTAADSVHFELVT